MDIFTDMDNQPGPQDDPVNLESDEGELWGPEDITETGQESRWSFPLFFCFLVVFSGVAIT